MEEYQVLEGYQTAPFTTHPVNGEKASRQVYKVLGLNDQPETDK